MAVLLSVRPKWCELIASEKKTVEVRKTRPKIETPFKCYIYQTADGRTNSVDILENNLSKVIGEFVCESIYPIRYEMDGFADFIDCKTSCLKPKDFIAYGKGKPLYGWHISDLVIYDKPKELNEFYLKKKCNSCKRSGYESSACIYDEDCIVPVVITRPPQSWCYVQDLEG
jgi:predicted transcriptional regulator